MFGLLPKDTLDKWARVVMYYAVNFRSYEMSPHCHKAWEIMLAVNGTAEITYWPPGKASVHLVLHDGMYIIIDSGVRHELHVNKEAPCRMLNVELEAIAAKGLFSLAHLYKDDAELCKQQVLLSYDHDACVHSIIISLQRQLKWDKTAEGAEINWILGQLFLTVSRQYNTRPEKRGNPYVFLAEEYIAGHYEEELTIEDIARHIGISRAYLQRLFQKQNGCSMVVHINALRIEKAKFLLLTSSLSIMDIAVNVGFNNRQHFSGEFHRRVGCAPGEFRKKESPLSLKNFQDSQLYPKKDTAFFRSNLVEQPTESPSPIPPFD